MDHKDVVIRVAGETIRFRPTGQLVFSPMGYRGFAINADANVSLDIEVSVASVASHDESDSVENFVGDCRGTDMPDHCWQTGSCANGDEYVVIDFFANDTYHWVKLTFGQSSGTLQLSLKDSRQTVVDPYIFPLLNLMVSRLLRRRKGFLIHSSVVSDNGNGYLFTAVSGTGKSTMARIWQGCGATIINDDMLALIPDADGITVHNIPMPYYDSIPRCVRLKGIFLISQSKVNFIEPVRGASAALRLMANTIQQPSSKVAATQHLAFVGHVAGVVPIFSLGFKPDSDIVHSVRNLNL